MKGKMTPEFKRALQREHNAPVQPYLPRSIARIRQESYIEGEMIEGESR
jgi:hypothetical protein